MPSVELLNQYKTEVRDSVDVAIDSRPTIDNASLVAPFAFLFIAGVVTFHKFKRHQLNRSKQLVKTPCHNCRFFSDNRYLKCAVQPDIVLTKASIDCSDYYPQTRKLPVFSLRNKKRN